MTTEKTDVKADVEMADEQKQQKVAKEEVLSFLDGQVFAKQQYLWGNEPTLADKELHEALRTFGLLPAFTAASHPSLFAWYTLIDQFHQDVRLGWPETLANPSTVLSSEKLSELNQCLKAENTKQADERREKQKWENYVPKNEKRPLDEFYDLSQIYHECLGDGPEDISDDKDEGMLKYLMKASQSRFQRKVEEADIVYYTCETRFDNGQLVDFNEKRKAKNKFDMADPRYHEHIRKAFLTMRKGDLAWIKYSPKYHNNIYHKFCKQDHLHSDKTIGEAIFIKLCIDTVKRQPVYSDQVTYQGKLQYFEKVREICKELIVDEEYVNAKDLYSRCLGEFKNMPRQIRDALSDDQKSERNNVMLILNLNLSLCHLKRNSATDAIKHAKEAIKLDPKSSKAHYRLSMAHKLNNDLDPAKEHLKMALQLEPQNQSIRQEYQQLCDLKSKKEKQWYSAMSGFYDSEKLKRIEKKEASETTLREKVKRKHFGDDANPSNQEDQEMNDDGDEPQKAEIKIRSR